MTEAEFKYINGMLDLYINHLILMKRAAWEQFFGMDKEQVVSEAEKIAHEERR